MVKNYINIALRNIAKHKFFSLINISGLTVGVAACLFVAMYIYDELNYDQFHDKGERIYRLNLHGKLAGQEVQTTYTAYPIWKAMVEEIPEVLEATRVDDMGEWIFRNGATAYNEEGVIAADSNFFDVFGFKLFEGNTETALREPNSIVINEKLAEKYFGEESPLGKSLAIGNDKTEYKITGVMENERTDSHLKFNALLSSSSFSWMNNNHWLNNSTWTYYVLQEGASSANVDKKFDAIMERNVAPSMQQFIGKSVEEFRAEGGIYEYYSIPMYDIHLYSDLKDEQEAPGNISYVYIMAGIGIFIVILACINFMNLTTAKSAGRAKEVGLRKTLGSLRRALVFQFLAESMIYALLAALLALALVFILLPSFNLLSGKALSFAILGKPVILVTFIFLILFVGILAGSYPAFYLTGFKITEVLKGKLKAGIKSGNIRSFLVTFQFWISIILIICTAIVYKQLQFIQDKNLGIDKEHIVIIEDVNRLGASKKTLKNTVEANTSIIGTSFSNNTVPGANNTTIFRAAGKEQDYIMSMYYVDHDHLQTFGFELAEGRFFSKDFPSDSGAVVLNEAAVRELGWEDPQEEKLIDFNDNGQPTYMNVVGVVKDFNYESLKLNVRPLVLRLTETGNVLYVRFKESNPQHVIESIQNDWNELVSGEPFQYSFLDEDFDALFRAEQRLGKVFTVFTSVAIFIACLGLFGLSAFMAEQRTKEIGIRKVMGASLWSVATLMSKDFAKLVLIAFVLAIYPAYYFMEHWLDDFANKIDMPLWIFLLSGITAIIIAWLTVSYQSLKAARVNPVKSLRYE